MVWLCGEAAEGRGIKNCVESSHGTTMKWKTEFEVERRSRISYEGVEIKGGKCRRQTERNGDNLSVQQPTPEEMGKWWRRLE